MPIDNNFYKKLKQLCDERGVKPTPVVKSLGISATNLKRWENGATVNSDILNKIADYFQVPVDFFFDAENDEETFDPIENETSFKDVFNVAKAHSDYIVSFLFRKTVYDHDLNTVVEATDILNPIIDKAGVLPDDIDVLDIYAKEKGEK